MTTIRRRAPMLDAQPGMAATAVLTPPLRTAAAVPAETLRPNLQMLRLHDWHIENVGGRRLLRFTTIFVNRGPGPFELRGARTSRSDTTMAFDQVLYRADGSRFRRSTQAFGKYAGDGHDHWHVQNVVTYEAWALSNPQRDAARGQDRLLLLRHHAVEPVSCRTRGNRATTGRSGAARWPP